MTVRILTLLAAAWLLPVLLDAVAPEDYIWHSMRNESPAALIAAIAAVVAIAAAVVVFVIVKKRKKK